MVILIVVLFILPQTRKIIDTFSVVALVKASVVRIPVELVLYGLFLEKAVPEIMTFEGRNFDILAGISAPIVAYLYSKRKNSKLLIIWNILGLSLIHI